MGDDRVTPDQQTALLNACAAFTGPQEGDIHWPYRDSTPAGNITVGRGHLIASPALLAQIFGVSEDIAQEEWDNLMEISPGHRAAFYETCTDLALTQEQDDALFQADLAEHVGNCERIVTGFDALPQPIQVACQDIDFNVIGGLRTFPHFIRCVEAGDWIGAAEQSDRPQLPARSAATKKLILSVVQPVT